MSAGITRAAYERLQEKEAVRRINGNNVPKRTKLTAEGQREYGETHKNLSAELSQSIDY
jgi:hypothetical protein